MGDSPAPGPADRIALGVAGYGLYQMSQSGQPAPGAEWSRPAGSEYFQFRPPDADGQLTLGEAKRARQNAQAAPVQVDLNRLDLSGISATDFPRGPGSEIPFRTRMPWDFLVHGTITLGLDRTGRSVSAIGNVYDFDIKPWNSGTFIRNIETIGGRIYNGPGTPYHIEFLSNVPVPPRECVMAQRRRGKFLLLLGALVAVVVSALFWFRAPLLTEELARQHAQDRLERYGQSVGLDVAKPGEPQSIPAAKVPYGF